MHLILRLLSRFRARVRQRPVPFPRKRHLHLFRAQIRRPQLYLQLPRRFVLTGEGGRACIADSASCFAPCCRPPWQH